MTHERGMTHEASMTGYTMRLLWDCKWLLNFHQQCKGSKKNEKHIYTRVTFVTKVTK